MDRRNSIGDGLLNAVIFLLGPAALTLAIAHYVSLDPPQFAHPSQAAALEIRALAPILAAGAFGIFLSVAAGMTANPLVLRRLGALLFASVLSGALFGAAVLAADHYSGFSRLVAETLGISSIHIAFPASAYVYAAGGVAVECLYRLVPVSVLYFIVARLLLRGRGEAAAFWILAFLSSLIEPLSQAPLAGAGPNLVWAVFGLAFVFNFLEAGLWRRYGWLAPIVARLVFYAVWHVIAGPLLTGTL